MSGRSIPVAARMQGTAPMPVIPLEGGPYSGAHAVAGDRIDSVLMFPDRLHVKGLDGSAIYRLENRTDDGVTVRVGVYVEAG